MNNEPIIVLATLFPMNSEERSEQYVLRKLISEYLTTKPKFELRVHVYSAHLEGVNAALTILAKYPIKSNVIHIHTSYAGQRAEEISFCKEFLSHHLAAIQCDYILYMDADVWTSIRQVESWIALIGANVKKTFIKIKYCLRDGRSSPAHTLGAYFHHQELVLATIYWQKIFPRNNDGTRNGAPDCCLHDYLSKAGCNKIVPPNLKTYHFTDMHNANTFEEGVLSVSTDARNEIDALCSIKD